MGKQSLNNQFGQLEARLSDAENAAARGGKAAMAKLENKVHELEAELAGTQARTGESAKAYQRAERKCKELAFTAGEDKKNQDRMTDLASKLQSKIKTYKQQIEEAEGSPLSTLPSSGRPSRSWRRLRSAPSLLPLSKPHQTGIRISVEIRKKSDTLEPIHYPNCEDAEVAKKKTPVTSKYKTVLTKPCWLSLLVSSTNSLRLCAAD